MRFRSALLLGFGLLAGVEGLGLLFEERDIPAPEVGSLPTPSRLREVPAPSLLEREPLPATSATRPGSEALPQEPAPTSPTPPAGNPPGEPWTEGLRVRLVFEPDLDPAALERWLASSESFLLLLRLGLGSDGQQLVVRGGVLPGPRGLPGRLASSASQIEELIRAHPPSEHIWAGPIGRGPVVQRLLRDLRSSFERYLPFLVLGQAPSGAIWRQFRSLVPPEDAEGFAGVVVARLAPGPHGHIELHVELHESGGER